MANWAENRLRFAGSRDDVAAFLARGFAVDRDLKREVLDFNAWIPLPHVLKGYDGRHAAFGAAILSRGAFRLYGEGSDLFSEDEVKASGTRSYEDLEAWARVHKPEWIAAGPAGLRALEATGFVYRNAWMWAVWGANNAFEYFRFARRDLDHIELEFNTMYTAPAGVIREIARQFPAAHVWAAAYERGHEYGFRFESREGVVDDRQVQIDEALLRDVEGASYPREVFRVQDLGVEMTIEEFVAAITHGKLGDPHTSSRGLFPPKIAKKD